MRSPASIILACILATLGFAPAGIADTFETPGIVVAQVDGSFRYKCKFVKGPGSPDVVASYGWFGAENVGGGLIYDCFCLPGCEIEPGDSIVFHVEGALTDPAQPGRVEQSVGLCNSSGRNSSTVVKPYNTTAVGDPTSGGDLRFWNEPNPLSARTTFHYSLREAGPVALRIYDGAGRRVATVVDEYQPAGRHSATWDARSGRSIGRAGGVYFARLATRDRIRSRTLVITP